MIALICGGRDFINRDLLFARLDYIHAKKPITMVVQGGAKGADLLAKEWAISRGIHCAQVDALWDHNGRAAGPIRNQAMLLLRPDIVIAFAGGRGTKHMVYAAKAQEIPVLKIED